MRRKKLLIILSAFLALLLLLAGGYFLYPRVAAMTADQSWIEDLGYREEEIYELQFSMTGIPEIPVSLGNRNFRISLDTGNSSDLTLTDWVENGLDYTLIGQTEQLNRDGSHRGWSKSVLLHEFTLFGKSFTGVETEIADWETFSSLPFNGMENLLFFEAIYNGEPVSVYLDTGKNHSYLQDPDSAYGPGENEGKPASGDISITIGDMELPLHGIETADLAQVSDLPYPLMIELNSDQISKNHLLITIDLIEQKIIFRR